MRTKLSKTILFCGLAAVAVLTAMPSTGWLVRQQLKVLAGGSAPGAETAASADWDVIEAGERAAAAAQPDDYGIQLAWALRTYEIAEHEKALQPSFAPASKTSASGLKGGRILSLLPLRTRFRDHAEMQADILRYLCMGDLKINRSEEDLLLPPLEREDAANEEHSAIGERSQTVISPEAIRLAEDAGTRGETLDPQNAYFPAVLAAAFLADHKDTEAFVALARAADKPQWNDYAGDEARARISLLSAANGAVPGGVARVSIAASTLMPQFSLLRDEAREMTGLAVQHELSGDREGGFAIRRSMARVGATMRAQHRSLICSFVGAAMTTIVAARPGGSAAIESRLGRFSDSHSATFQSGYVAYLNKIGHGDEASWYVAEHSAGDNVTNIGKAAGDWSNDFVRPYTALSSLWIVCLFLMSSVILTIAAGGAAALLSRAPRVRAGEPMQRGIRVGLLTFIQVPVLFLFGRFLFGGDRIASVGYQFALIDMVAFGMLLFFERRRTRREFLHDVANILLTIAAGSSFFAASMWFGERTASPLQAIFMLSGLSNSSTESVSQNSVLALAALACAVPTLTVIVIVIRSRMRRIPVSIVLVRGIARFALPAAAVLLLMYVAAAVVTLHQESEARILVEHEITDECKFFAELHGIMWPGPVTVAASHSRSASN